MHCLRPASFLPNVTFSFNFISQLKRLRVKHNALENNYHARKNT